MTFKTYSQLKEPSHSPMAMSHQSSSFSIPLMDKQHVVTAIFALYLEISSASESFWQLGYV